MRRYCDTAQFERCIAGGGIAVFPTDTVYGLACDPLNKEAVDRIHELKRRPEDRPSAVMFFKLRSALDALGKLGERTERAIRELLPAPVTVLLPNEEGLYPLACGGDAGTLGLRVPRLVGWIEPLGHADFPVFQTSANLSGGSDPCRLSEVPGELRDAADLTLDGGELPGTPSTVVDLSRYEESGNYFVLREGAVSASRLKEVL